MQVRRLGYTWGQFGLFSELALGQEFYFSQLLISCGITKLNTWFVVASFWLQSVLKIQNTIKSFWIKMLIETYLCFHCLENIGSQQLYGALSRVASIVRKCFVFHYHLITHGMEVSEMVTAFWSVGCQLAIFADILVEKCVFHSPRGPKWLQLGALLCSGRCLRTSVNIFNLSKN